MASATYRGAEVRRGTQLRGVRWLRGESRTGSLERADLWFGRAVADPVRIE